jgi:putative ABC transport system ATP-binding protein
MKDAVLSLREVTKTYGEGATAVEAVKRAELRVHRGELILIMGPSGSGKTTLLSLMGCLMKPSTGAIEVQGRRVDWLPEAELPSVRSQSFGFIFQDFNLFPQLTAEENVALALDVADRSGERPRAAEVLGRLGLADKVDRSVRQLSGGQKQRVAIARALVTQPLILLCDEPTAALDTETGLAILKLLRAAAADGRGVVVVSHDPRLKVFADRVLNMHDGILEEAADHPGASA